MRNINKLIIHCSATPEGREVTIEEIDKWHKQRGFKKIGYHYVIYLDGSIHKGREEDEVGAHCEGQNSNSIGICYIGGCDSKMNPKDTRTNEQKESLILLVKNLLDKYELSPEDVYGHYQFASKACPSFDVEELKKELV